MLFKDLFLVGTLMFTNSVIRQVDGDNKEERKGKFVEPRYNFNHPPSVEYYNPIPVSIVYEENSGYSEKSDHAQSTEGEENLKVNISFKENEKTTPIEEENVTISTPESNVQKKVTEIKTKPQTLNDFQIPVSIVYESDSDNKQTFHRTKTETETNKRRPSYTRKLQDKSDVDNINGQTTQIDTENPKAIVEAGIFKKRTGGKNPVVPILESESYVFSHNGNFHYSYEGGDGTKAYSEGKSVKKENDTGASVVGGFSYTDKEGNDFSLSYTADENGYRPVGDHLPTPPPIPPAIARALAYLATAPSEPVTKRPVKAKPFVEN